MNLLRHRYYGFDVWALALAATIYVELRVAGADTVAKDILLIVAVSYFPGFVVRVGFSFHRFWKRLWP